MKKIIYFYIFRAIIKLDKWLFKAQHRDKMRPSGVDYTVCIKGHKFYQSCKCGSTNGRC